MNHCDLKLLHSAFLLKNVRKRLIAYTSNDLLISHLIFQALRVAHCLLETVGVLFPRRCLESSIQARTVEQVKACCGCSGALGLMGWSPESSPSALGGSANTPLKLTTGELLPAVQTYKRPSRCSEVTAGGGPPFYSIK